MNEPGRSNRADQGNSANTRKAADSIGSHWAGQIYITSLPIAQGIPVSLRTGRKERQAHRALRHLDVSGRREHGLQGRPPPVGGVVAGRRLKGFRRLNLPANWRARPASSAQVLLPQPENFLQFMRRLWAPARQWALGTRV